MVDLAERDGGVHLELRPAERLDPVVGRRDVVLIVDRADELFEQIFQGDQAGDPAVLVQDDRDLAPERPQLGEQVVGVLRLGDEVSLAATASGEQTAPAGGPGRPSDGKRSLAYRMPEDVVAILAEDRDPAQARSRETPGRPASRTRWRATT